MTHRNFLFAALSGLLLALIFPTVHLHVLAWVSLTPLFLAVRGQSVKNAFWLGAVSGLVFFAGTLHWITHSLHFYGNIPLVPASLITLLLCAYLAMYPALFGAALAHVNRRNPALGFIAAPCLWTALELARTHIFTGFPWALLGYSQYTVLPVIQIADVTGVYGVSFLIVLVNASLFDLFVNKKSVRRVIATGLVLLLVLAYGLVRQRDAGGAGEITVSAVQGNIEQDKKWDAVYQAETIGVYTKLTRDALVQDPDLVIWPETSVPFYFGGSAGEDRELTNNLREFAKDSSVPLLFGSPTYAVSKPKQLVLRNTAFLLGTDGTTRARYDKFHLVPFGEYVPLKNIFFFVEKIVQTAGDFVPGNDYTVMTVQSTSPRDVKVGTVICYEIIFPDLVRKFVKSGANVMITITNDAWFGRSAAPYQHFSMAVFRAIENRVPVARAANTGITGFIDSRGRILAATDIFTRGVLTRKLVPGDTRTFYTLFGDLFSYLCILASVILILAPARKSSTGQSEPNG